MQQVLNPRPLSASWYREVLQFKWNFALSVPLHSWIWLHLHINQLHHALLADAVFYWFATMKCLNPVFSLVARISMDFNITVRTVRLDNFFLSKPQYFQQPFLI